jgi:putative ABC transport system ATP-binding protein
VREALIAEARRLQIDYRKGYSKRMAFVEFKNVYKFYGLGEQRITAADDMCFSIEKGEFCVITGPSGAGKTTLLNILGGMDACDQGTIFLDNTRVSAMTEWQLTNYRRHEVGFVFQFYNLIQNLTTLENVEMASEICRDPLNPVETLIAVGLGERLNNFPAQLSGGEQQRVAIARALAKNPKILLCDEPTGALDYETGKRILKLLQESCRATRKTVVVITHNQAIARMADRVIQVKNGKILSINEESNPAPVDVIEW